MAANGRADLLSAQTQRLHRSFRNLPESAKTPMLRKKPKQGVLFGAFQTQWIAFLRYFFPATSTVPIVISASLSNPSTMDLSFVISRRDTTT